MPFQTSAFLNAQLEEPQVEFENRSIGGRSQLHSSYTPRLNSTVYSYERFTGDSKTAQDQSWRREAVRVPPR